MAIKLQKKFILNVRQEEMICIASFVFIIEFFGMMMKKLFKKNPKEEDVEGVFLYQMT
jgi:hypothetical protein